MSDPGPARIDAARWLRLKDVLAELSELEPGQRASALDDRQLTPEDRRDLEVLLSTLDADDPRLLPADRRAGKDSLSMLRWQIGDRIGDYCIEGYLGGGGMAEVYAARGVADASPVALKMLRQGLEPASFAQFSGNEQRALQRLDDPRIARFIGALQIPQAGTVLVLERVEGESLDLWCQRLRPDLDQRLQVFVDICEAVGYAHQQLVIHRDLKPSNVLVTPANTIKLLDFGIAKLLDEDTSATRTHGGLYTLAYAAPEQVLRQPVSTATDVYALGALLFNLLTGQSPYSASASESLVKSVLSDAPRSLTSCRADTVWDRDLDRVIARAMEKDPRDRYRSALELAADVQAIRSGNPISAGGGRGYRIAKFVRRHPAGVAMAASLLLVLLAATAISLHWAARAQAQARLALLESQRANAVAGFLVGLFQVSDPGVNRGDRLTANQILDRGTEQLQTSLADQPLQRARLQVVTGEVYIAMGDYARAQAALEPAAAILRDHAASLPQETAEVLQLLAQAASRQANQTLALEYLAESERVLMPIGAVADSQRARIALLRCRASFEMGRFDQAGAALAAARSLADGLSVADAELTAGIHAAAADLADETGAFEVARLEYQNALAGFSAVLGDDHYRTVALRTNLGALLVTKFDDFDGAQPLLEQALRQWRHLRGADSAAYASTANTLGELHRRRGDHDQAARLYADSERAYRAALGPTHPSITWPICNLARSLNDRGRYASALGELQRALPIVELGLPENELRVAQVRKQSVGVLLALGRHAEALRIAEGALGVFRSKLPADHPDIVNSLYQIGLAHHALGDKSSAQAVWQQALEGANRAFAHLPRALADMRAEIADPDAVLRGFAERAESAE